MYAGRSAVADSATQIPLGKFVGGGFTRTPWSGALTRFRCTFCNGRTSQVKRSSGPDCCLIGVASRDGQATSGHVQRLLELKQTFERQVHAPALPRRDGRLWSTEPCCDLALRPLAACGTNRDTEGV